MVFGTASEWLQTIFGGDAPGMPLTWWQIVARGFVIYVGGLTLIRLGKSRLLARSTPLDMILAFILGSVLSRGITGSAAISGTLVATGALIVVHWTFTALACRFHWFGRLFKGNSYVLVSEGVTVLENLRRSHISEHDLEESLRLNANINRLDEVELAMKERSGEIGIVKRTLAPQVIDVNVADGVQTVRIALVPVDHGRERR